MQENTSQRLIFIKAISLPRHYFVAFLLAIFYGVIFDDNKVASVSLQ